MEALKEMYAKVEKLDKEIAESDDKVQLCRTCRELMETKIENQNKLMQQREYWLERIDQHKMLTNITNYLQSKADERKAKQEAKRKAEEEEAAPEASAEEEADKAATTRPIAKVNIARKKPRTREI